MIVFQIVDFLDAGLQNHFRALQARKMCHIYFRILGLGAEFGALQDCIHFRVDGADTVPVHDVAALIDAVDVAGNTSVVSSGYDAFVSDDCGTDLQPFTSAPQREQHALCHKILIPRNSFHAVTSIHI